MPKNIAQPRPAPPPASVVVKTVRVYSTKDQEAFASEAEKLAEALGWSGPADNELNGISVSDAQGFLCKVFHEIHQDACHPFETTEGSEDELQADKTRHTTAIVEHLGITDTDEVKLVTDAVWAAYDRECSEAPASPQMVASNTRVANMSANLKGDVSSLVGGKGAK